MLQFKPLTFSTKRYISSFRLPCPSMHPASHHILWSYSKSSANETNFQHISFMLWSYNKPSNKQQENQRQRLSLRSISSTSSYFGSDTTDCTFFIFFLSQRDFKRAPKNVWCHRDKYYTWDWCKPWRWKGEKFNIKVEDISICVWKGCFFTFLIALH